MFQPMRFVARSSYTKHYPPKSASGQAEAADLKDSMELRADMNPSATEAPCPMNKTTTYSRDYFTKRRVSHLPSTTAGTVVEDPASGKVGENGAFRRQRFDSTTSYHDQFKGGYLPNYSKTSIATLPENGGMMNVPLEASTTYGAEFQSKRVPVEPRFGNKKEDNSVSLDARTTYGGAHDGRKIDANVVRPDDSAVKAVDEFRSFSTEHATEYQLEGFKMPPKGIRQCSCYAQDFCPTHG